MKSRMLDPSRISQYSLPAMATTTASPLPISIIIPVLHEEDRINGLIDHIRSLEHGDQAEVLVVDGDRHGSTLKAMDRPETIGLQAPRGRARQMNAGALRSTGEILLFLHADTRLPCRAFPLIAQALADPDCVGGAFDLKIDSERFGLRLISRVGSRRSRRTRVPYGDQAIFIRRTFFQEIGGFPDIPLMEDLELMTRIRNMGRAIIILDTPALTSSRRWEQEGLVFTTLRNWILRLLYHLGVPPNRLAAWYRARGAVKGEE